MFIINTATTNTANVTGVHLELGVSPETIVDVRQWRRSRGVFDHVTSLRNADAPLRLLSLQDFSAQEKAEILRSLDLDVLVDLSGFTQNGEPEVLARRPAGIQVNYLGFPAQMGVRWMDFNLLDNEALPPHFTGRFTDKVVYLPYYYACDHHHKVPDLHPFQRPKSMRVLRNAFSVPNDGVLLCFPNQLYKLTESLLTSWSNVLRRLPEGYLWLLRHPREGEQHIRDELMSRGISSDRILFSDFEEDKAMYMVRTSVCDVVLDSPLWSAGATGLDAYWSGVPIISLPGDRIVERLGASLMVGTT